MSRWCGVALGALLLVAACGTEVAEDDRNVALPAQPVVEQIAIREEGACALNSVDAMWCWGTGNTYGNGDGTTLPMPIPNPIVIGNNLPVASLGTGRGLHNCAVITNGDVYCWGYNFHTQAGGQLQNIVQYPTKVMNMGGPARQVVVGMYSTCALMTDSKVKCWGGYNGGFIGSAPPANTTSTGPRIVPNLLGVTKLAASRSHICALLNNGAVKCWGKNTDGQIGNRTNIEAITPADVSNLGPAIDIAAGKMTTCAVLATGQVRCWGSNRAFGMGFSHLGASVYTEPAQPVLLDRAAVAISVGGDMHCALLDNATVSCWGQYPASNNMWYIPSVAQGMTDVAAIATGAWNELCGLTYAGGIKCMGTNFSLLQGVDIPRDQVQVQPAFVAGLGEPGAVVEVTTTTSAPAAQSTTTTAQQTTTTTPPVAQTTTTPAPQTSTSQVATVTGEPTFASDQIARTVDVVAAPLSGTPEVSPTSAPPSAKETSTTASATARTVLTLKVKKSLTATALARYGRLAIPKGAKVAVSVPKTKKICSSKANKVTGLKAGPCRVRVTVKPKAGKSRSATVAITVVP